MLQITGDDMDVTEEDLAAVDDCDFPGLMSFEPAAGKRSWIT